MKRYLRMLAALLGLALLAPVAPTGALALPGKGEISGAGEASDTLALPGAGEASSVGELTDTFALPDAGETSAAGESTGALALPGEGEASVAGEMTGAGESTAAFALSNEDESSGALALFNEGKMSDALALSGTYNPSDAGAMPSASETSGAFESAISDAPSASGSLPSAGDPSPLLSSGDPMVRLEDGEERVLRYVPPVNSEFAVYLFGADAAAARGAAELSLDGEIVASGSGSGELCSAWLVAGEEYELRVRAAGSALVEVARSALSRCFGKPLGVAENAPSGKMIARAYDAHWYEFTAEADGRLMLTCVPEEPGLELRAALFDDSGARIAEFEALPGGACMLLAETIEGAKYALRVCAPGGGTGYYLLTLHRRPVETITSALRFDGEQPQRLAAGSAVDLSSLLRGEALLWASDAPDVVAVTQTGAAIGVAPGVANVTAYGMSSQASCQIAVEEVPLEGLRIVNGDIRLSVGDELELSVAFTPQNASDRRLNFDVADASIAGVSERGVLSALSPGETELRVSNENGEISDAVKLTVYPAGRKYRALLVGEQRYPFGVNAERRGSENSVNALAALLESGRFETTRYEVRTGGDLSRAELIAAIREHFGGAAEGDVSLLYLTCHGNFTGGMSFLELSDGSVLSARDLERELRKIRGEIVVLIDCCGSGGAIGAASERVAFARGFTGVFSGAAIRGSRYRVICSAGLDEDSYRLAFNDDTGASVMTTVFSRALCDGAGWDIDRNDRGTMGADANYDGAITLEELAAYASGRVNWYLELASELTGASYRQGVHVIPEGDPFILFQ